jgi:hypothetical protein
MEIGGPSDTTPVPGRPGHLADAVIDSIRGRDYTSGFRVPALSTSITAGRELTYVVTDSLPPDPNGTVREGDLRLLILANPDTERWYRAQSKLPLTLIDPDAPRGLRSEVDELDPSLLRALITSAVKGG